MPDFYDAHDASAPVAPFSNSTEGDAWLMRWCENCVHEHDCPLMTISLIGRTPAQWQMVNPGGTHDRYDCTMYQRKEGGPDARG